MGKVKDLSLQVNKLFTTQTITFVIIGHIPSNPPGSTRHAAGHHVDKTKPQSPRNKDEDDENHRFHWPSWLSPKLSRPPSHRDRRHTENVRESPTATTITYGRRIRRATFDEPLSNAAEMVDRDEDSSPLYDDAGRGFVMNRNISYKNKDWHSKHRPDPRRHSRLCSRPFY
eukprot:CCRYP_012354-RA/>CCRYP_012354-RA protein AED:0.28 eAED:0.28 QI:0/-1/0/1/-1/1/1/0/170